MTIPVDDGITEVHLDSRATAVPRDLSSLLLGVRGAEKLVPTVKVVSTRSRQTLINSDGETVLDVVDERVRALHATSDEETTLRRVTVSSDGAKAPHKRLVKALRDLGAEATSGDTLEMQTRVAAPEHVTPPRLAGLIDRYVQAQLVAIGQCDLAWRQGLDVAHPYRVAIRRLRSTLHTFADCFEPDAASRLDGELSWLAVLLGDVRDAGIERHEAAARLAELQNVHQLDESVVDTLLADGRDVAVAALSAAMDGRRYAALVGLLETWRVAVPYTKAAGKRRTSARGAVALADKRFKSRLRSASKAGFDEEFHGARRAAKRLRYAVELASPVLGKDAKKTLRDATRWQERLGVLQDSVMTGQRLSSLGATAATTDAAFALGVLASREWAVADDIRASLRKAR